MNKLNMQTTNIVDENIKRIGELFPNCLTERLNDEGRPEIAIDFDQLRQVLSKDIVEGNEERYQFTWPDKRNAIRLANVPTTDTLRPVRDDETKPTGADSEGKPYCSTGSVNFDTTQNLYIEGDNLQVLKLLREDYLGKIKMIYIDPPYNTGNDFVYDDDFNQDTDFYKQNSGQTDTGGNRLVANVESNGRFHTDWLNMIYPRLKVAKDLLSNDGVIFISIDDNEIRNLKIICDEVFGEKNFVNQFVWINKPEGRQIIGGGAAGTHEYILVYARNFSSLSEFSLRAEWLKSIMPSSYKGMNIEVKNDEKGSYITTHELYNGNSKFNEETRPTLVFDVYYRESDSDIIVEDVSPNHLHEGYTKITPHKNADGTHLYHAYRWSREKILREREDLEFVKSGGTYKIYTKRRDFDITNVRDLVTDINTNSGSQDIKDLEIKGFSYPKPVNLLRLFINLATTSINEEGNRIIENATILDFFSGSATTAHAVMQLNAEDGGKRKFIMVQLPEETDEKSEARKAGYKNICEIGKERIRRAGKKIKENSPLTTQDLDTGFRVLKLDSSNMEDVYYMPVEFKEAELFEDNIKPDRTEEDLLFQTMIDLGIELSAKIEQAEIVGKTVWNVADGYLLACFDENVNETTITEIAKQHPYYFVMRDASLANDQVADNFEQIFEHYSKDTIRKIL